MFFLYIVFYVIGSVAAKERTANLVVLPPLVLGYDELYSDETILSNETKPNGKELQQNEQGGNENDGVQVINLSNNEGPEDNADSIVDSAHGKGQEYRNVKGRLENIIAKAKSKGKSNNEMKELDIVGKLVLPQSLLGSN